MLSVTNPPICFRAFSKHKLGDETGKVADGGSNFQSDKKSWLTRTLTVSIDQCRMEPSKNFNRCIQIGHSLLRWKDLLELGAAEEPQRDLSTH